uniref:NARG2_C domain-containing protein n=1 Tax=Heligmosomoides polygyrus TaxID=6339 RepID=A0A8L8Q6I3_HELPZ
LIHAFRDDHFTENVQETGEMVCRMRYVQDRRVLFQVNKSKVRQVLSLPFQSFNTEGGERLKNALHAMRYLECSAKQMNGVKFVFFETLSALKRKPDKEPNDDDFNISMSPLQGVAAVLSRLGSSGPLLKIDSYLPFSLFGTTPAPPSNSAANRDSLYNALDLDGTQCDRTAKANTPQRFTRSDRTEQKYVPQRDNRPVDEDDVSRNEESPTSVVSTTSTKSSKSAERPSSAEKSSEHGDEWEC